MKIAVIGMGKIDLPLAAQFASKGHDVVGVDINPETVADINHAREPFPGEALLGEYLARLVPAGNLSATSDYGEAIPDADAIVVVVPLFVDTDGEPDFGWLDSATKDIAANLSAGSVVLYETTLPVGTTRTRWKPLLEAASGLIEGRDFHIAFSPERVLTGRVFEDLRKYPKLLGGLSAAGARAATAFYQAVLDFDHRPDLERANGVWDLGSAEAAEMAKLAETTYRDVNIGLANQFAKFAEQNGIDVYQVIEASNSQPYSHIHRPGIAVGGHCIPVYPRLYLTNDPAASIVETARNANAVMPRHAVDQLGDTLGTLNGRSIAILGLSYRPGVKEAAYSGAHELVSECRQRGATPLVHDPLYSPTEIESAGFATYRVGRGIDGVILHTAHPEYANLRPEDVPGARVVIDGRNHLTDPDAFTSAGVQVHTLGKAKSQPASLT